MADATITLKLTPGEFDFLRNVIRRDMDLQTAISKDQKVEPAVRRDAREQAGISHFLLEKLTS